MEPLNVKAGDKALIVISKYGSRKITRAEVVKVTPKQVVVRGANGMESRWWLDGRGEVGSRSGEALMWSGLSEVIPEGHEKYQGLLDELDHQRRKQRAVVALREAEKAPEDLETIRDARDALEAWQRHLEAHQAEDTR